MVELSFFVKQTQQQRADLATFLCITESTDHAIGGAHPLDLHHRFAISGVVWLLQSLRYDSITPEFAVVAHPTFCFAQILCCWRQPNVFCRLELSRKSLQ